MHIVTNIVIAFIAIIHIYFLILEMFLWDKPFGLKTFSQSAEAAKASKVLASNQGLYNGFLASGLIWGLFLGVDGFSIKAFFLCCILIAGIYGGFTSIRKIFYIQAAPAALALALLFILR